jgi:hypothetical protein
VEGALETSERMLRKHFGLASPAWLDEALASNAG